MSSEAKIRGARVSRSVGESGQVGRSCIGSGRSEQESLRPVFRVMGSSGPEDRLMGHMAPYEMKLGMEELLQDSSKQITLINKPQQPWSGRPVSEWH